MKPYQSILTLIVALAAGAVPGLAQALPATRPPATFSLDQWSATNQPPFFFKYSGKDSSQFISGWQRSETVAPSEGGQLHRYSYLDPSTKLRVTAEVRSFSEFDAIEWVLRFTNDGTADTPILEEIQPLRATVALGNTNLVVHSAGGSSFFGGDFAPVPQALPAGETYRAGSSNGRSSSGQGPIARLPFLNIDAGDRGLFAAIGWSGNWLATIARDKAGKTLELTAGMPKTHLLLHPGETIRTPRILLLNWRGNVVDSHNVWRRLALAYYSPKDQKGQTLTVPIALGTWGTELADAKVRTIRSFHDQGVPLDVYWIDAGWYGGVTMPAGKTLDDRSDWPAYRGDWYVSKRIYPQGLRPIGELLKQYKIGFLLWIEAEGAMSGSLFATNHPDWYLSSPKAPKQLFLNLGNPAALTGMTDFVSNLITESGLTWYRQDSNMLPAEFWDAADSPDRIGMTEIGHITGLYAYWDALRTRHPGLQVDNCAGGGTRLDLESMSRSVCLWRSDYAGNPMTEQAHSQGLMPWVPLSAGVWDAFKVQSNPAVPGSSAPGTAGQLYELRSAYCAGLTLNTDYDGADWMKSGLKEFQEVRPYFYGDFYALTPQDWRRLDTWAVWQLDRPDLKSGIALLLRRPESRYCSLELHGLHGIDPEAQYQVEIRTGLARSPIRKMSGADLARLPVTITDMPGSALVLYRKQ